MSTLRRFQPGRGVVALAALLLAASALPSHAARPRAQHEARGFQLFLGPQAQPLARSADGSRLYVANTTTGTVSVLSATTLALQATIEVGMEPVALAVRPDGREVWVANHVSDSVSVIDADPASPYFHRVVATVQDLDASGVSHFDEPVGVAFASDAKAYVALSSTDRIAVVDVASRAVTGSLAITAQEPRAIAVRNGLLYVAAFESGNQSELSSCASADGSFQCTLDLGDIIGFATSPNLPNQVKNIVVDPDAPDRDLFVFDTSDDSLVDAVAGVGTLLYGIAVDASGRAFVAQTDARNAENGADGLNLIDLQNRMFLNQVAVVSCNLGGCGGPTVFALEPAPPAQPPAGLELATPYGIAVSDDGTTVVATAAGTGRVFTLDAANGSVLDVADVGASPRGVTLASDPATGAPRTAWVLDTLGNAVSRLDVSDPEAISVTATVPVGADPTPETLRRGRIAFADAFASSSGTFSCESCHPDGHTDQLLWRIGGACGFGACSGDDEPRTTMPVRGLKNTLPLHWDGTLGDPFGGPNGAVGTGGNGGTDCALGDADGDHDCFVDLVNGSLAGVMCDQGGACPPGGNELTAQEIDDMASFLAAISYPPARGRRMDDTVTTSARNGFSDFFLNQGGALAGAGISTCADADSGCHALPLGTSSNSPVVGAFDAPTLRGMTDRFIHFSNGFTSSEEIVRAQTSWLPADGPSERMAFAATFPGLFTPGYNVGPDDLFQMFEEASTGHAGALGRQVTLSQTTTTGGALAVTEARLDLLETADARDAVNLRGPGRRAGANVVASYRAASDDYQVGTAALTRAQLLAEAQAGTTLLTLTAFLPAHVGSPDHPQPLLAPSGTGSGPTGNPDLPVLPGDDPMTLRGVDVHDAARILVDGQPVAGTIACSGGSFAPLCTSGLVVIDLATMPSNGAHRLQVQNPKGPFSNELPICVGPVAGCL